MATSSYDVRHVAAAQNANISRARDYYSWITHAKYLPPDEEASYVERACAGDADALDAICRAYSKFAYLMSKKYVRRLPYDCLDDLLSEAFIAIIEAVPLYKPKDGKLISYIGIHIKRRLSIWSNAAQLPVYVPRNEASGVLLRSKLEAIEFVGGTVAYTRKSIMVVSVPLDDTSEEDMERNFELHAPESDYQNSIILDMDVKRIVDMLDTVLSNVPKRNADIYKLYYGIPHGERITQPEIAKKYKLSTQAISLILAGVNIKIMKDSRTKAQIAELKAYVTNDWSKLH